MDESLELDIPEGYAASTLKVFAKQAGVEIIFDLQVVDGVRTNAVKGEYDSDSALRMMLENTYLEIGYDGGEEIYSVVRKDL